jgi:hypothetical protein
MTRAAAGGNRALVDWAELQIAALAGGCDDAPNGRPWVNSKLQAP